MSKSRILTDAPSSWVDRVWRKNSSQIYKLCRSRSRDAELAKDLFQEVALRFCRSAGVLDHDKSLIPWFRTVVRNTYMDMYRKRLPIEVSRQISDCCKLYADNKVARDVCEMRRAQFVRHQLDRLMVGLNVSEKLAIEYLNIGGIRAEEACRYCGVDKGTFFKRKASAFRKMRERKDIYLSMMKKMDSSTPNLDDLLTRASEFS